MIDKYIDTNFVLISSNEIEKLKTIVILNKIVNKILIGNKWHLITMRNDIPIWLIKAKDMKIVFLVEQ